MNQQGALTLRATAVGAQTVLAQISAWWSRRRARSCRSGMVDRVTLWFRAGGDAGGVLTFVAWMLFGPDPRWGWRW